MDRLQSTWSGSVGLGVGFPAGSRIPLGAGGDTPPYRTPQPFGCWAVIPPYRIPHPFGCWGEPAGCSPDGDVGDGGTPGFIWGRLQVSFQEKKKEKNPKKKKRDLGKEMKLFSFGPNDS